MSKNYALLYIPDLDTNAENINFVCSDNKIHFRFKDFIRPECIQGFEKKLTYLMTYLINSKNDIDNQLKRNRSYLEPEPELSSTWHLSDQDQPIQLLLPPTPG